MREMHMPFSSRDYRNIDTDIATTLGPKEAAASYSSGGKRKEELVVVGVEPRSVLDNRSSPSRSSSSLGLAGGGGSSDTAGVAAAVTDKWPPLDQRKEEWASNLQPIIPPSSSFDIPPLPTANEWEEEEEAAMFSDPAASLGQEQEQTFLHWLLTGDVDCSNSPKQQQLQQQQMFFLQDSLPDFSGLLDTGFGFPASSPNQQVLLPPVPNSLPTFFQEPPLQNPPPSFLPLPPQTDHTLIVPPPPKRQHHSLQVPFTPSNPAVVPYQLHQRPGKPKDEPTTAAAQQQQQQQALVDQLLKAAELVETGSHLGAREILARLNHQLPASPFGLKPLLRSAIYFKESLLHILSTTSNNSTTISNPWDVVLKLSAWKAFSEASPFLHFANFTCTQTLLEELADADRIHIVDFDIGVGGHWSSFMLELARRRYPATPFLKITAFVSPSSFHPLELQLTRQNLSHFAAEQNIPFELNILSIESFDPNELLAASSPAEAVAVNLPVGCHYGVPFPTLLRLVKQLAPKVLVSVERGCDRSDLSFTHSFLHCFQSCMVLLDSIDAAGASSDVAGKIERFLVQPWVEGALTGRHRAVEKMHPWRTLLSSVGFVPVQFSNFTEAQAECLLRRVQVRGFHVEKRQASLFLYWQRGELGSVSAWRC